jgi:bifunctional NMN adenylyltransferase/nudix hydrolase
MSNYEYDFLIYTGRFQPLTLAHESVMRKALEMSEKLLILIGSCEQPRSYFNPWTGEERKKMILGSFNEDERARVIIEFLVDFTYNDTLWSKQVQTKVIDAICQNIEGNGKNYTNHGYGDQKIGLVGYNKDSLSFDPKMFPQWKTVEVPGFRMDGQLVNATDVRKSYFDNARTMDNICGHIPESSYIFLDNFMFTDSFDSILEEYEFVTGYNLQYKDLKHPVFHTTVDSVVVQSGHILLIKRKGFPGKGLWALPGGFVKPDEKLKDAMVRELIEETKLKVPEDIIRGSIKKNEVFDEPRRSSRGRTITHAYYIPLKNMSSLPKVKAADDAKKAEWIPLAEVRSDMMFEDHIHIIRTMVGEDL